MNGFIGTFYFWVAEETCTSFISGDSCNDPTVLPILGLPVCMVFPARAGEEVLSNRLLTCNRAWKAGFLWGRLTIHQVHQQELEPFEKATGSGPSILTVLSLGLPEAKLVWPGHCR